MNSTKMFIIRKKNNITEKVMPMDMEMAMDMLMATGTDLDRCMDLDMVMEMGVGMGIVKGMVAILAYDLDLTYENKFFSDWKSFTE